MANSRALFLSLCLVYKLLCCECLTDSVQTRFDWENVRRDKCLKGVTKILKISTDW